MKEHDKLMAALEAWYFDTDDLARHRSHSHNLREAYADYIDVHPPLVLEQCNEGDLPSDDGSTSGRLDITDEGTFYFNGISYKLPETE